MAVRYFGIGIGWVLGVPDRTGLQNLLLLTRTMVDMGWTRSWHLLKHMRAGSGGRPVIAGLQHPTVRAKMSVGQAGKAAVTARTESGPSLAGPNIHRYA